MKVALLCYDSESVSRGWIHDTSFMFLQSTNTYIWVVYNKACNDEHTYTRRHLSQCNWTMCSKSVSCSPELHGRQVFGLWTTLEGKFIQKDGVRRISIGIIVFLMKSYWQWQWSHSNIKRWLLIRTFKVKNELNFPFVDTLLYITTAYYFDDLTEPQYTLES